MQSEEKQPSIFLVFFVKVLLSLLLITLSMALIDPFFVAYKAENIEWVILAILIFLIFTQPIVQYKPELYAKRRMELQNPSSKEPPSVGKVIVWLVFIIGFIFLIIKSAQVNIANHIPEFRDMAIPAMQQECAKNCAVYGVTQSSLIGPKTEKSYCCTDKSGYTDFLFSWHSNAPDVTLKVKIKGTHYPLTITSYWIGNKILNNVTSNESSHQSNQDMVQESRQLTRNDMDSVILQNESILKDAYQHSLKVTPSMHGSRMVIQLTLNPDGHVTNAQIVSSDLNSSDLKSHLLNIFRNLQFSSGNFKTMNFTYSLNF
jgi:hypothetical protein